MPTPILDVRNARKRFGNHQALVDVNFVLYPQEILGFLGPNGAGKTTMIRSICGRVKPDAGEILLLGKPLTRSLVAKHIGFVPQDLAIYHDLTTLQNLKIFGQFYGVSRKELRERIEQALVWSGLTERKHHLTGTFSGGMKRRLNIACGILHRPAIVLLDEPTVGVDPQSREFIFRMLEELRKSGTGILMTTHHLEDAQQRCNRIVIIDHGQTIMSGTLPQLIAQTWGQRQYLTVRYTKKIEAAPEGFTLLKDGRTYVTVIDHSTEQIASSIQKCQSINVPIEHLTLERPSLQHTFLKLTGKDLRE